MNFYLLNTMVLWLAYSCVHPQSITPSLVGTCQGCEAILDYQPGEIKYADTLQSLAGPGQAMLICGQVFKPDGRTPASEVILYLYQTNQEGIYPIDTNTSGWALRHGKIRLWLKTNSNGEYCFYTLRPGSYPDRDEPAHIHLTILEPDGSYYWLDSYKFSDDPMLKTKESEDHPRGGGNPVLNLTLKEGLWQGNRDITLRKWVLD